MDAPAGGGDGEAGPSPADIAAEEQAWDEAMHQAASLAKAQGRMPGAVEETVRGAHATTVDWRTLLRRYMTDASKSDYSWSMPNRRFIDSGLYLPSIRSEGIDTIAVIVDTSGSLPAATLAEFWAEVREIANELQPERVILLQVDAAVQDAAEYAAADLPDEIAIRGRGGTDFRPGFAWLEEHDIQPGVCLYLTPDHARQMAAWEQVAGQGYRPSAWQVKRLLTEERIPGTSAVARFVGVEAYEAAGGKVLRDLFSNDDDSAVWFDDLPRIHSSAPVRGMTRRRVPERGPASTRARPGRPQPARPTGPCDRRTGVRPVPSGGSVQAHRKLPRFHAAPGQSRASADTVLRSAPARRRFHQARMSARRFACPRFALVTVDVVV